MERPKYNGDLTRYAYELDTHINLLEKEMEDLRRQVEALEDSLRQALAR